MHFNKVFLQTLVTAILVTTSARAATYYVDYTTGSDGNNGASRTTPWKRHPYMVGFSGNYNHTAGDRFIFKGGVTWPRSVFQLHILAGGASDSVRDYYGADSSWYSISSTR